jgi:hypothetical protein
MNLLGPELLRSMRVRQDGTARSTKQVCGLYVGPRYLHVTLPCNSIRERAAGLRCVAIPGDRKTQSVARPASRCEASLYAIPVSDRNVP